MQQNRNAEIVEQVVVKKLEYKGLSGVRNVREVKDSVIHAQIERLVKKYECADAEELVANIDGYETVEEMKADLFQAKVLQYAGLEETSLQDRLLEQLAKNMETEIPDALLAQQVCVEVEKARKGCIAHSTTLEKYVAMLKQTMERFEAAITDKTIVEINKEVALHYIAKAENVTITPEEVLAEYQAIAEHRGCDLAQAKRGLTEKTVIHALTVRKVRELLVQYANITLPEA